MIGPKILFLDIETSPLVAHVWKLWDNNVSLNQLMSDWVVLSWAAKWSHSDEVLYADQSQARKLADDRSILKKLWRLLNQADVIVTHYGKKFDVPKLYARFVAHGFQPPKSVKHIDTKQIASNKFAFTSNKLEHLANHLRTKHRKLKHSKFEGHDLWVQCIAGNPDAWAEMRLYNCNDVLVLQDVYHKLVPWDDRLPNFSLYYPDNDHHCRCGSTDFNKRGYHYTAVAKYQCYRCVECGAEIRDRVNLLKGKKKKTLRTNTRVTE